MAVVFESKGLFLPGFYCPCLSQNLSQTLVLTITFAIQSVFHSTTLATRTKRGKDEIDVELNTYVTQTSLTKLV